jgi:hypothetical protein
MVSGWLISDQASVTCDSCKAWLAENDKHTYSEMVDEMRKMYQEDQANKEKNVGKTRGTYVYTSKGPVLPGSPAARRRSK